jgi:hypothetical protein
MKTKHRIFGMLLMAMAIIFMDACKGEKGDVGPAGTAGVAGPTGANGAVGVAGPTGTANVIYGSWIDMNVAGYWYKLGSANTGGGNTNNNSYGWGADFAAPITQDILDKGVVLVYGKYYSGSSDKKVYLLPGTAYFGQYVTTELNIVLNRVYIQQVWSYKDVSLVPTSYSPSNYLSQFRYIIIPGSVAGGRKAAVDYSDYEAVKAYYGLKD